MFSANQHWSPYLVSLAVLSAVVADPSAAAAARKTLAIFVSWSAFAENNGDRKVCYAEADAVRKRGKYTRRGDVYIQVILHLKSGREEIAIIPGYRYKPGSRVTVKIGRRRFRLVPKGATAWTRNRSSKRRLLQAMRRGRRMIVQGVSSRGTLTTDTYSLIGFSDALRTVRRSCKEPKHR